MFMTGILIAALAGILMSVQGVCNTGLSEKTNLWLTSTFVSMTAAIVCLVLWLLTGRESGVSDLLAVQPRYRLLGGLFGAAITGSVVYAIARLGTAKAELVIVVAQLAAAYLLALTGWLGSAQETFSLQKLFALLLACGGVIWYCV